MFGTVIIGVERVSAKMTNANYMATGTSPWASLDVKA